MKKLEHFYANLELRAKEDRPANQIAGYFSVFDSEYNMGNGITERIDKNAFKKSLEEDDGSIRCLWNHDSNIVLGRTGNGTLRLMLDEHGLYGEIDVNEEDSDAMNALARIKRGDVSQCSIGFEILSQDITETEEGALFTIRDAKLWEVSPVTFPAYKATSCEARSAELTKHRKAEFLAWQQQKWRKLNEVKETFN